MNAKQGMAIVATACLVVLSTPQADQLVTADFGLPNSSYPTGLADVNGTLFFVVGTECAGNWELSDSTVNQSGKQ